MVMAACFTRRPRTRLHRNRGTAGWEGIGEGWCGGLQGRRRGLCSLAIKDASDAPPDGYGHGDMHEDDHEGQRREQPHTARCTVHGAWCMVEKRGRAVS